MRTLRTLVHVSVAASVMLALAATAQATPIVSANPLLDAGQTILFSEFAIAPGAQVTNQFASLGVTFDPFLYYDTIYPATFPGITGHRLGDFLVSAAGGATGIEDPFSIRFTSPVNVASFGMATNIGISSVSAFYQGHLLESFSYASSPSSLATAFVGFDFRGLPYQFDQIVVNPGDSGIAMIDSLQFTTVPEPASLLLMGTGVIGLFSRRRRRRQVAG